VLRRGCAKPRFPIHYFFLLLLLLLLLRLLVNDGRIRDDAELRPRFLRLLPLLVVGEWTYGISAFRYVFRRPDRSEPGGRTY